MWLEYESQYCDFLAISPAVIYMTFAWYLLLFSLINISVINMINHGWHLFCDGGACGLKAGYGLINRYCWWKWSFYCYDLQFSFIGIVFYYRLYISQRRCLIISACFILLGNRLMLSRSKRLWSREDKQSLPFSTKNQVW